MEAFIIRLYVVVIGLPWFGLVSVMNGCSILTSCLVELLTKVANNGNDLGYWEPSTPLSRSLGGCNQYLRRVTRCLRYSLLQCRGIKDLEDALAILEVGHGVEHVK